MHDRLGPAGAQRLQREPAIVLHQQQDLQIAPPPPQPVDPLLVDRAPLIHQHHHALLLHLRNPMAAQSEFALLRVLPPLQLEAQF